MINLISPHAIQRRLREIPFLWQRLAIIVATLFLSLALPLQLPRNYAILIYGLPFLVMGVLLLLRQPPLGLIMLIVVGLIIPIELVYQLGIVTLLVMGLTGLWLFDMFILRRQITFLRSSTIPPLLILIAVAFISFGIGQFPWYPTASAPIDAQLGGILIYIVAACAFILVAHQIKDVRWLKWMVFVFLAVGSIYILQRVVPGARVIGRVLFPSTATGSLFWIWLIAFSFSQGLFNKQLSRLIRIMLLGLAALTLFTLITQLIGWSSGWIPALIAMGVILWVGLPRVALPLTVIGGVIVIAMAETILLNVIYVGDNAYSQVTRVEAWRIIGEIVKVSPFFGLGPANYSYYTPLFPILGWYVQFNSHSNYVDLVAQTGLLGLAAFAWFAWEISKVAWRLRLKVPKGGFEEAYVFGAIGGLVATLVSGALGDWILPFVYNITIRGMRASMLAWLFLGGLVALEHIIEIRSTRSQDGYFRRVENGSNPSTHLQEVQ